jgi:hypothetical protein
LKHLRTITGARRLLLAFLAAFILWGCPQNDQATVETDVSEDTAQVRRVERLSGDAEWHVLLQGLPEAVLSLWMAEDGEMWFAGADAEQGDGPIVLKRTASGWTRYITGAEGHLWWVLGTEGGNRFFAGVDGTLLHYTASDDRFRPIETGTETDLYGVWGTSPDSFWVVGGDVYPEDGEGIVLHVVDGVAERVMDLPTEVSPTAAFFKVWGTSDENLWIVGEQGHILHFDGVAWTLEILPEDARLVTIHGQGDEDMVAVGGFSQATIVERQQGGQWLDVTPSGLVMLNGVYVHPDGMAAAAGLLSSVLARTDGTWTKLPSPPVFKDWHAVWVDPDHDVFVVGGSLMSVDAMDQGAVLRYGPAREDPDDALEWVRGSSGEVEDLDVLPDAVSGDAGDVLGDTSEIQEIGPEEVEDSDTLDAMDLTSPESDGETGFADEFDGAEVAETTPDVDPSNPELDVVPEDIPSVDVQEVGPIQDVDSSDTEPAIDAVVVIPEFLVITLGFMDETGEFQPIPEGQPMEIVQGPQGGIHLEVVIDAVLPAIKATPIDVTCYTYIEGDLEGYVSIKGYPTFASDVGTYRTNVLTVFFKVNIADAPTTEECPVCPYAGKDAEVHCDVESLGQQSEDSATVFLVDEF